MLLQTPPPLSLISSNVKYSEIYSAFPLAHCWDLIIAFKNVEKIQAEIREINRQFKEVFNILFPTLS